MQPPLPQREKRRPGRKPNKPMTAQPSDNDEKELDIETLKRPQNEDDSLSFIINLKEMVKTNQVGMKFPTRVQKPNSGW